MGLFDDVTTWASNAANAAGKALTHPADTAEGLIEDVTHPADTASAIVGTINDGAQSVGKVLGYIPLIGPLYSAIWTHVTSPLDVFNRVVQGQRIDLALLDELHNELKVAKTVAPYAQMVMQLVPGVGPIASGAISAGIALAEGQTIDQALLEGVKGALPGGPLARAAFTATQKALNGQNIGDAISSTAVQQALSVAGVTVPDNASLALSAGVNVAKGLTQGKDIKDSTVSAAIATLPATSKALAVAAQQAGDASTLANTLLDAGRKAIPNLDANQQAALDVAIKTGLAMGVGQYFQSSLAVEVAGDLHTLADMGQKVTDDIANAAMKAALNIQTMSYIDQARAEDIAQQKLSKEMRFNPATTKAAIADFDLGFKVGAGLMVHGLNQGTFNAVRSTLTGERLKGFDTAVSYAVGKLRSQPVKAHPQAVAGYLITKGMIGLSPNAKADMIKPLAGNANSRAGASLAIGEVQAARSWWKQFLSIFGL